jgi:hypothetical protein
VEDKAKVLGEAQVSGNAWVNRGANTSLISYPTETSCSDIAFNATLAIGSKTIIMDT